jgi:hypothetical protein
MRNYIGKTIYLGMDVHKKTYAVTAVCDGQVVKKDTLKAEPTILINYCKKYFVGAQIKSAYEAGFCGFHLHRCLESEGIKNLVVDAAGIEIAVGDRVKTDKRDSLKLATHLADGRLKGIHVPTAEREDHRAVTRLRDTFVRQRSRFACQLKALLFQHGLIQADDQRKISLKWIKALEAMPLSHGLKYSISHYIAMWKHMDAKVKEIYHDRGSSLNFHPHLFRPVASLRSCKLYSVCCPVRLTLTCSAFRRSPGPSPRFRSHTATGQKILRPKFKAHARPWYNKKGIFCAVDCTTFLSYLLLVICVRQEEFDEKRRLMRK